MSLSNASENDLLLLLFNNANWANLGDAVGLRGSTVAGSFFVGLHTADPGEAGTQLTSAAAYTNYVRIPVARSAAGWTVSGSAPTQAVNVAAVTFASSGSGPETETYVSVGRDLAGAGEIIFSGIVTTPAAGLVVNPGIIPSAGIGLLVATLD